MDLTEAETGTSPHLLRRCKWLKHPGQDFPRYPDAVIGDLDHDIAAGKAEKVVLEHLVPCRNAQYPAARHRIACVESEV
jgi:hypothetical protein